MSSVTSTARTNGFAQHTTVKHLCAAGHDYSNSADALARGCRVGDYGKTIAPESRTELHCSSSFRCNDHIPTSTVKFKKSVRWATITVHEFGVGLGGSAVSNKGGPSIGLADTPEFTWTTRVGEMAECVEGVHRFTPSQRIRLLQAAGIPDGIITRHARETNIILGSRRRSKTKWKSGEGSEEDNDEEEEERRRVLRKRNAEQAMLEHSHAVYLRRPHMIPVNYV